MIKKLPPNQQEREKTGFLSSVRKISQEDFIYFLIILLIPTQLGKHFWPPFSYISGIRIDYLSPTLYITDVLILLLLLSVFLKSFKNGSLKLIKYRKISLFILAALMYLVINVLLSKNIPLSAYGLIKVFESLFFGFYTFLKFKKLYKIVIPMILCFNIILQSLISVMQYIKQASLGGVLYFLGERTFSGQTPGIANVSISGDLILRAYGTFSHPNVLGGFLLISLTFILFNEKIKKSYRYLYYATLLIGSLGILVTFSRLPLVLWIVSIFFFIFSGSRLKLSRKKTLLFGLAILTVCLLTLSPPFVQRFTEASFLEESIVLRVSLINDVWTIFKKSPLIGQGIYNFIGSGISSGSIYVLQPVHNIYLLTLVQTGLVGFIIFAWIMYKTFRLIKEKNKLYLKLLFSYILLIGFFDHYFLTIQQGQLIFSFLLGYFWSSNE